MSVYSWVFGGSPYKRYVTFPDSLVVPAVVVPMALKPSTSHCQCLESLLLAGTFTPTQVIVHPCVTFQTEDGDIYSNSKVSLICLFPLLKFEL